MGAVNVEEEDYSLSYDELPGDLIEEILAWLPAEYLCRFANVCKQWNALFSSTNFLRKQWAEAPPNKIPWLVVIAADNNQDYWVYSSFTRSWKNSRLSLSFLERRERSRPNSSLTTPSFRYLGSCTGLFLIQGNFTHSIYVCNPLTAKYFVLPPMTYIENFPIRDIGIVEEGEDGYKVLVLHYSNVHQQNIVEIYDSIDKAWTMAPVSPRHMVTIQDRDGMSFGTVFSGGYFYCLMVEGVNENGLIIGIMGFNIVEGTSIFVQLPDLDRDDFIYFNGLVGCGSRVLYVEGREIETQVEEQTEIEMQDKKEVTIWEFNKDAATNWKQVSRMPPTVHLIFNMIEPIGTPFECAGMGDCLYFRKQTDLEVAVYNFTKNSWTFLPSCPIAGFPGDPPLIAFQPRPDMEVE